MAKTKRTFGQYDLFHRGKYANFLKQLILNSDSYHRDDDVQAYTIAIDSPWGTGKSVFLEMFEDMLETDCSDRIRVVHYNAWKNDFWGNAFEPFADAIFTSEWFCNALQDDTNEQSAKKFLGAAKNVMLSFLKKNVENHCDAELLVKAIEDFANGMKFATTKNVSALSKSYLDYVASLKQMQDAMDDVLANTLPGGKLVIIIDELDRCRPTFAIETLEIVKHIMDVKDVVYIFSLDMQQLGATIKQVYGGETDATGYLMRFFSYYSRMPDADIATMIQRMWEEGSRKQSLVETFAMVAEDLALSARDVETVGKVFKIMEQEFLSKYASLMAYKLYWILLCYKYKRPLAFDSKMKGGWSEEERQQGAFSGVLREQYGIENALKIIAGKYKLEETEWNYIHADQKIEKILGRFFRIDKMYSGQLIKLHGERMSLIIEAGGSLSGLLFLPDLERWDEIKNLTPAQFLLQQMEMFNFIPEIPSATE